MREIKDAVYKHRAEKEKSERIQRRRERIGHTYESVKKLLREELGEDEWDKLSEVEQHEMVTNALWDMLHPISAFLFSNPIRSFKLYAAFMCVVVILALISVTASAEAHERSDYAECVITAAQPNGMAIMKHTNSVLAYCANLKQPENENDQTD